MRKIRSKADEEKKKQRNQVIFSLFLVGVLVFGTIGYAFTGRTNEEEKNSLRYNGIEFYNQQGYWRFIVGEQEFTTKYNPKELENILSLNVNLNDYTDRPLYFVNGQGYEIARNLNGRVLRMQEACLGNCSKDLPIKNCSNDNIIVFNEEYKREENCVYIPEENQTMYEDRFIFDILNI